MTNPNPTQRSDSNHTNTESGPVTTGTQLDGLPTYQSLLDGCEIIQPRTIILSGVLIFPSEPPANALYQLSRDLVAGTRISISRIDHEIYTSASNIPTTRVKDRQVYTFSHRIFDDSSIEMLGKRRGCFPSLLMSRTLRFHEERWFIADAATSSSNQTHFLFHCKHINLWLPGKPHPYRWYDANSSLIAVEDEDQASQKRDYRKKLITNPSLRIIKPLDQKSMDALVASWCARIWNHNLRATSQIKSISKGKNASFKGSS